MGTCKKWWPTLGQCRDFALASFPFTSPAWNGVYLLLSTITSSLITTDGFFLCFPLFLFLLKIPSVAQDNDMKTPFYVISLYRAKRKRIHSTQDHQRPETLCDKAKD